MTGMNTCFNNLRSISDEIINRKWCIEINHICRGANRAANWLAKMHTSMPTGCRRNWGPSSLRSWPRYHGMIKLVGRFSLEVSLHTLTEGTRVRKNFSTSVFEFFQISYSSTPSKKVVVKEGNNL